MEGVYDHVQEEQIKAQRGKGSEEEEPGTLTTDLQETYKSFTASPWGAKLGGFWGTVRDQSESYINEAKKEASLAREEALKGFTDLTSDLVGRARGLSLSDPADLFKREKKEGAEGEDGMGENDDAIMDADGLISTFKSEAAKRLQDLRKAEDAADAALLRFGSNIRDFLREAVTVTAPKEDDGAQKGSVLFESKDADGKRVIHTTRFDAQLHVIHCSLDSFTKDPASAEYEKWKPGGEEEFEVNKKTDAIAADLTKYEELRRAMEKLSPLKVDYETFWRRYYFLRMVIESEEKRRREMLKGAAQEPDEADLAWDEDSDEEPSTPQAASRTSVDKTANVSTPLANSTSISMVDNDTPNEHLKVAEPRKSQDEKSQADSESSYDLVSGATSRTPGSPKDEKPVVEKKDEVKKDESDEEDWE